MVGWQKINQKNTWELSLIDHLSEIIKVEVEENSETNFQKVRLFVYLFRVCCFTGIWKVGWR